MKIKKLGTLIALILCITIGGVYATWTYTQSTDVADETVNMSMNLGSVAYIGSYGTYKVDGNGLSLTIEPKSGTAHTTSLVADGKIVITFTPNVYAPEQVKENAVDSTWALSLPNANWKYDDGSGAKAIVTILHNEEHQIVWQKQGDGSFTYEIQASDFISHIQLTEFSLDTKGDYDSFNTVLGQGQIAVTVSDGEKLTQA